MDGRGDQDGLSGQSSQLIGVIKVWWEVRADGVGPVLKVYAQGVPVRGTKQVWGDQKADGPEILLALRAEGTRVSS